MIAIAQTWSDATIIIIVGGLPTVERDEVECLLAERLRIHEAEREIIAPEVEIEHEHRHSMIYDKTLRAIDVWVRDGRWWRYERALVPALCRRPSNGPAPTGTQIHFRQWRPSWSHTRARPRRYWRRNA